MHVAYEVEKNSDNFDISPYYFKYLFKGILNSKDLSWLSFASFATEWPGGVHCTMCGR